MPAAWRAGVQVTLLDHRLAAAEISPAPSRLTPQFLVRPTTPAAGVFRGGLRAAFRERYPATLFGNMYGMTDVGVIATDLSGRHAPAVQPAPGLLTINGRLDSQVSIGGLKVDLTAEEIQSDLGERLAAYKRPRPLYVLGDFPRTATGKIFQNPAALRSAARDAAVR